MYFDPYYLILIIPAFILSIVAQFKVTSAFNLYAAKFSQSGISGHDAARIILDMNGLSNVEIGHSYGKLSDHFDPRTNSVNLSERVYSSSSIASIGVAAHEVGHAIQYAQEYMPMKIRGAIIPAAKICSTLAIPLALLGIFLGFEPLATLGIALYCVIMVFQIITLPVEYNASKRAMQTLIDYSILNTEELSGAEKVLTAAAMTYVAALISSVMNLLRLLFIKGRK